MSWFIFRSICSLALFGPLVGGEPAAVSVGKLRADADAAMLSGDVDKSIKLLDQVRRNCHQFAVASLIVVGRQVIQLEPDKESNYVKRYRAHLRKRKYRDAFSDLSAALKINPE